MVEELESMLKVIEVEKGFARVHAYNGKKYLCKLVGAGNLSKESRSRTPRITDKQKSDLVRRVLAKLEKEGKSADIVKEDYKNCSAYSYDVVIPRVKYRVEFYQIMRDLGED